MPAATKASRLHQYDLRRGTRATRCLRGTSCLIRCPFGNQVSVSYRCPPREYQAVRRRASQERDGASCRPFYAVTVIPLLPKWRRQFQLVLEVPPCVRLCPESERTAYCLPALSGHSVARSASSSCTPAAHRRIALINRFIFRRETPAGRWSSKRRAPPCSPASSPSGRGVDCPTSTGSSQGSAFTRSFYTSRRSKRSASPVSSQ